jgi:hypothetical protein
VFLAYCFAWLYLFFISLLLFFVIIILLVLGKLPVVRCARHVEERWPGHSRKAARGNRSVRRADRCISGHRRKELLAYLLAPCGCPCHGSSAQARRLDPRLFDGSFGQVNNLPFHFFICWALNMEDRSRAVVGKGYWTDGSDGILKRIPPPNWSKLNCLPRWTVLSTWWKWLVRPVPACWPINVTKGQLYTAKWRPLP